MAELRKLAHPFHPLFDEASETIILGSFPSVKSVKEGYYYANPHNRFYEVMGAILKENLVDVDWNEKKRILLAHHIALHDVIGSCQIEGSSDATIHNPKPSKLKDIIEASHIQRIYCNGQKAYTLYQKYFSDLSLPVVVLPSTSPANAKSSLPELIQIWGKALNK
jgi:double-stranded uracil-DNA glycosylase